MSVTMKDVASHANVSLATVSNCINRSVPVSIEKRERIESSIKVLGYKMNQVARGLKTNSFKTVGVIFPSFSNRYLMRIATHVENALREAGYSMLLASCEYNERREKELLSYLSQYADGIIHVPTHGSSMEPSFMKEIQSSVPIVTFEKIISNFDCDNVVFGNKEIAFKVVDECLKNGHEHIALLLTEPTTMYSRERLQGYLDAHVANGKTINYNLVKNKTDREADDGVICSELLNSDEDISIIFVTGYKMTLAILWEIKERGLESKIRVVGYDAEDIQNLVTPKLCYVSQPRDKIAREVVDIMCRRIDGDMESFPLSKRIDAQIENIESIQKSLL